VCVLFLLRKDNDDDPLGTAARSWKAQLAAVAAAAKANLRRVTDAAGFTTAQVAPEDDDEEEDGEAGDPKGGEAEKDADPPPRTAFQRAMAFSAKAAPLRRNRQPAPPDPLAAFRAAEQQRAAASRAVWFDATVSATLLAQDELRRQGPNRRLSDLSDATVLPPGMLPFPTDGPPVSACGSSYYDVDAANLDSVD
jgi:hypothetical protein